MCQIGLGSCETWTTVLNKFALYLSLPALVFSSLVSAGSESLLPAHITISIIAILIIVIIAIIGFAKIRKWPRTLTNTYFFGAFFGNVAYIGPPFLLALYGTGVQGMISMIIAVHVAVAFSVGIFFLELSKHASLRHGLRKVLLNTLRHPLIVSVFAGLAVILFDITVPNALYEATYMLGVSASPVVLIAVGTFIASEWTPTKNIRHAVNITLLKLIAVPLIFFLVAQWFDTTYALQLSVLQSAMPVALSTFALAEEYPINKKIIANAIILSTIVSIITLSIWSALIVA
jgi:predicted permease